MMVYSWAAGLGETLKGIEKPLPRKPSSSTFYFCDICQMKLPGASRYEDHMNAHEGRKHHCGFCGKAFRSKERLTYHEKEHQGIFKYRCTVCQKGYNHRGDFRKHQEKHTKT